MAKKVIRLTESELVQFVQETINEISASLADKSAAKAYQKAREGFGKYNSSNEIPWDSPHGKKYLQGEKFLKYRNDKLSKGHDNVGIYYVDGTEDGRIALADYSGGKPKMLTRPVNSIAELEKEPWFNDDNEVTLEESIRRAIRKYLR